MLNVVLVEPEIPPNTGNIGRLCLATGACLHLVKPLGFSIDDKALRRAGLDYWSEVKVTLWDSFEVSFESGHDHMRRAVPQVRSRPFDRLGVTGNAHHDRC